MICLEFARKTLAADAGRIPSCIEWIDVGGDGRTRLLSLFSSGIAFNPEAIARLGWIGIDAETDGQPEDEDEVLLASMLKKSGIHQVLASSRRDILRPVGEAFLGARMLAPDANDLADLRHGWWTRSAWSDVLKPVNLLWLGWEELFCFTWPLQFAMVQLSEGEGHTTMVGPPDFINEFRERSNPDHWYEWKPWGLPMPPDHPAAAT